MSSETVNADSSAMSPAPASIEARAGRYYRNARFVIVLGMLAFSAAFIRDGFFVYPADIAKAKAEGKPLDSLPHPGWDVPLNRIIGLTLPPLALLLLGWTLYNSRSAYRLRDNTLHIPGHPPIPLDDIRRIDKRLWEKKGIAWVEYELSGQQVTGRFKLDDFVYQRQPVDQILAALEAYLTQKR